MGLGVELDLGFLKPLLYPQCFPLAERTMAHFHLLPLEIQSAKDTQGTPAPRNTILSDHSPLPPLALLSSVQPYSLDWGGGWAAGNEH